MHFVGCAHRRETERASEGLRAIQVGLLKLQPGDVVDFDHRVARPAGVLAFPRALLAVQIFMGFDEAAHG